MSHKLFIIDDNKGCCDMYKLKFEHDGWQVRIIASAERALEILQNEDYIPNVILLDLMLPKMQGDEFLKIIKNNPKTKDIKVIILTATSSENMKDREILKYADDYVLKTDVLPKELANRVVNLIN